MAYPASKRPANGAVMPFVAMSLCLLLITAGISVDLMRAFETVHQLEFGAQTAALYGLSLATNFDGSFNNAQAETNIQNAINVVASGAWNVAQAGAQSATSNQPVNFGPTQFVSNPLDPTEFFVQVTALRTGADALQQFFIPLAYIGLPPTGGIPAQVQQASFANTVEVIGQPATRIGNGAPLGSAPGSRANQLLGFSCLPIAISNTQFLAASGSSQTTITYTIDLVNSTTLTQPPLAGHIRGCLVNVAGTGNGTNYYGPGQGPTAISQLEGLLAYFGSPNSPQPPIAPALVEQGSLLSTFDPANANNAAGLAQLYSVLATLPAPRIYILPVVAQDPTFTTNSVVVGFAYFKLDAPFIAPANLNANTVNTLTVDIQPSVPVRNASSAAGFSSIPGNAGALMPVPFAPFLPRTVDATTNGISVRPRGIVLAPAVSPRQLALPIVPKS